MPFLAKMKRSFFPSSRSSTDEKEQFFLRNGSLLLEQLISLCHGKHNPIRTFSAEDLKKATNNYDSSLKFCDTESRWYKGCLEGRPVSIRKLYGRDDSSEDLQLVIREIAMAIKMSNHRSALKLLGCCLETPMPTLVYEFPAMGCLSDRILSDTEGTHSQHLTWKTRLRISFEIAHIISYLHTAFPRPIIHRDMKLLHFFLDEHFVPKLSDFLFSVILPEGQTYFDDGRIIGTLGYIAPEYFVSSKFTEKIDVYALGVILLQILTGQRAIVDSDRIVSYASRHVGIHGINGINGIVDPKIIEEGSEPILQLQQFQAVFRLAARCTKETAEERPTSTEVAKQLRRIQRGMFGRYEDIDFVPNLAQFFEAAA